MKHRIAHALLLSLALTTPTWAQEKSPDEIREEAREAVRQRLLEARLAALEALSNFAADGLRTVEVSLGTLDQVTVDL